MSFTIRFDEIELKDLPSVGGKNASLGEMIKHLAPQGINVPGGFAVTASGYWHFINSNGLAPILKEHVGRLDTKNFSNLQSVGISIRNEMMNAKFPDDLRESIIDSFKELKGKFSKPVEAAVRSSATAEDLPTASFAGQQESYLNIATDSELIKACHACFASLFTDRAIKYRIDNGFDHMKVALSIGIQKMVRSDLACAGVGFTIDPETGFANAVMLSGSWGLGENVVKGSVNPDEFYLFKPSLKAGKSSIISRKLGSKEMTMRYASEKDNGSIHSLTINAATPVEKQETFVLSDKEIETLGKWCLAIEEHYGYPMDIEWAKDGITNELFIVQARPETVHGGEKKNQLFTEYKLKKKGQVICKGIGLGNKISFGRARILESASQISQLQAGEILVTGRTDPDWDPVLKKAGAIITDQGGRTSHAAIIAREMGATAIVGTGDATRKIKNGQMITVSTVEGDAGFVYDGKSEWDETTIDIGNIKMPETKVMFILGHPDKAFKYSFLPNDGVGLMRMEFIINNSIGIHPMALHRFDEVKDPEVRKLIESKSRSYINKEDYFIDKLAEATAVIAAAFYPKDVIVRMSDFKSNEYANLIGGRQFEPAEENPMIGFRGASRYYHVLYREAFEMECKAMKKVRDEMGFDNIKLMIPFCRTVNEGLKVSQLMEQHGLKRNVHGLELYMMVEIPSNALLAEEFAKHFDGFSIGSNDLTQLTLGADRDSELLSEIFSPFDPAVMQLIRMTIEKAKAAGVKVGLCGQAPSDYPEYASFLVECGIDSISFNSDALLKGIENILKSEKKLRKAQV